MLNTEDGCIRYLMKEMDPSEEIEFEREMLSDENLLIEVETLRKTYRKLGKLPLKSPPEDIQQKVSDLAVRTQQQRLKDSKRWMSGLVRNVAAAAILFMAFSTGFYFYGDSIMNSEPAAEKMQTTQTESVEPWVDRNQVLRFAGTTDQPDYTPQLQTDVTQSFSRLKLVNDQTGFNQPVKKIVLTSSSD